MKKFLVFASVAVCLCWMPVSAFSQQPSQKPAQTAQAKAQVSQDVPAELVNAKAKLQAAQVELEHAGGEWGGFKQQALSNIAQALQNLNKATEYYQKNLKK